MVNKLLILLNYNGTLYTYDIYMLGIHICIV